MKDREFKIAKEIIHQIKCIDAYAMHAWGAFEVVALPKGLQFKSTGMCAWKGYVNIQYDRGADAYNIEFYKLRKGNKVGVETVSCVYADKLVEVIDKKVG